MVLRSLVEIIPRVDLYKKKEGYFTPVSQISKEEKHTNTKATLNSKYNKQM